MLSLNAYGVLSAFQYLCQKNSISSTYRTLHLDTDKIRACSAFGIMEVDCQLGIDKSCYVDAISFISLIKSLPNQELEINVKDTVLSYKCGQARGQLGTKEEVEIPVISFPKDAKFEKMSPDFQDKMELGTLACGKSALMSIGLYGILLDNQNDLVASSTDDASMSYCKVNGNISSAPYQMYLSPDSILVLENIKHKDGVFFAADENSIFCKTANTKLVLKQIPPMKHDLNGMISKFLEYEHSVTLNKDVISSFIKRAVALSEEKGSTTVSLSVKDKTTRLSFEEKLASSEEYYLTEDAPAIEVDPIHIESGKLAKALSYSDKIVFDYAKKNVLVFRGEKDEFAFIVMSKTKKED